MITNDFLFLFDNYAKTCKVCSGGLNEDEIELMVGGRLRSKKDIRINIIYSCFDGIFDLFNRKNYDNFWLMDLVGVARNRTCSNLIVAWNCRIRFSEEMLQPQNVCKASFETGLNYCKEKIKLIICKAAIAK